MRIREIISERFEKTKSGKSVTITGYHWSFRDITKGLQNKPLYFSDEPKSWASPWAGKKYKLFELTATMKNPYVALGQRNPFENPNFSSIIKKVWDAGYDGVIYTPHKEQTSSMRQAIVKNAAEQIRNVKQVAADEQLEE